MTSESLADRQDSRYAALLALIDLSASVQTLPDILPRLAASLAPAICFDECLVFCNAPQGEAASAFAVRMTGEGASAVPGPVETFPVPALEAGTLSTLSTAVSLGEAMPSELPHELISLLRQRGSRTALVCPLGRGSTPPRLICLTSDQGNTFTTTDTSLLDRAAWLLARSLDAQEGPQATEWRQRGIEADRDHWRSLLEVNNAVVGTLDLERLRAAIAVSMRRIVTYDFMNLLLFDNEGEGIRLFSLDPGIPEGMDTATASIRLKDTPFSKLESLGKPLVLEPPQMTFLSDDVRQNVSFRLMKRFCFVPLVTARRTLGGIVMSSRSSDSFTPDTVERAAGAASQVAIAIENALAFEEIAALRDRLTQEKPYLEDEIRGWSEFEDIVGESQSLKHVLAQVRSVADTETNVLLLGETGTGKELFARAIHRLSARRTRTLVAVNCSASPEGLLESEWFGYEKGAFTGALTLKAGRFELADKGTLFLDEVGDIPLHLQAKLLRVLQEREVERLGATRPVRVDFRLIAATNADLQAMVNEKRFRSDLFYRLNVFPIRIPPLRERPDDIPALVTCFTQRYARRLRRQVDSVPRETMEMLCRWPWPGNVRELQNVVERAVILSPGRTLQVPATGLSDQASTSGTLESVGREHILRTLVDCNWVVGGPNGAAARLGLKRTTLNAAMKRLGIERPGSR